MAFVVDASVAGSWLIRDERTLQSKEILRRIYEEDACAPSLWPYEVANLLLSAFLAGRVPQADLEAIIEDVSRFRVSLVPLRMEWVLPVAQQYRLSFYDASYLALAVQRGIGLATFDRRLIQAAQDASVPLIAV